MFLRRALVPVLLLLVSLMMPDSLQMSSGAERLVSMDGNKRSCELLDFWNFPRLDITTSLEVKTRPLDFGIVWSSTSDHKEGIAMTIDKFGNLFLSIPSALWGVKEPMVFLITGPFDLETRHEIAVVLERGAIRSATVDGNDVALRSLDGTVRMSDQVLKTSINRLCAGMSTSRPIEGDVNLVVLGGADPRTFQLVLLRVMLMVLSLILFLRTDQLNGKGQSGQDEKDIQ